MLSFLSSNNTPGKVFPIKYHLCWICTSNKNKTLKIDNFGFSVIFCNLLRSKFWNLFQAEIIPWSPMFLDFQTVFHMVWKSQESCESRLVGFWVSRRSKMQKSSVLFFSILSPYYGFANYFEILIFAFSSTTPRGISTCEMLLF